YGFKSEKLAQTRQGLNLCELRRRQIALKLEQLQFDLQQVAFAHVTGLVARFADVDRFLKAVRVLLRQIERRLRQQHRNELLARVEDQRSFVVRNGRPRYRGLVLRRLQPVLAFFSSLDEIADADVELRLILEIVGAELTRAEQRKELRVPRKRR